jgi:hypothetical protein
LSLSVLSVLSLFLAKARRKGSNPMNSNVEMIVRFLEGGDVKKHKGHMLEKVIAFTRATGYSLKDVRDAFKIVYKEEAK